MNLAYTLKSKGRHMPRQRFQRPEVRKMGSGGKQQWACDYFVYAQQPDGSEKRIHKVARLGFCAKVTKGNAQEDCDRFMVTVNSGAAFADASMTLAQWWEQVYKPVRGARWLRNTQTAYDYTWRKHIEPHVGCVRLGDVNKLTIDRLLLRLANAGLSKQMVQRVCVMLHAMLEEAVDNDVLPKNPARKVELPKCKPPEETRSMTVKEVQRLWDSLDGQDYLIFRVLIICGLRPNEAFALKRDDFIGQAEDRRIRSTRRVRNHQKQKDPARAVARITQGGNGRVACRAARLGRDPGIRGTARRHDFARRLRARHPGASPEGRSDYRSHVPHVQDYLLHSVRR